MTERERLLEEAERFEVRAMEYRAKRNSLRNMVEWCEDRAARLRQKAEEKGGD